MATVSFKLKHSSTPGEKSVIVVDFYVSREIRTTISTKEKVSPSNWTGTRVKNAGDRVEINQHLTRIENELLQLWRDNKTATKDKLISDAIQIVQGTSAGQKKTLFEALEKFLSQYKAEKERKTLARYDQLKTKLIDFAGKYNFDFENLDFNFFDAFKQYLYDSPNPHYPGCNLDRDPDNDCYVITPTENVVRPVGLFDSTVFKYIDNIQTFLRWSEKRGYKVHPSYKEWKVIDKATLPIALTLEELEALEAAPMPNKHIEVARDYLALECRMGARISNIKKFDIRQVTEYINDEKELVHEWTYQVKKGSRTKTQTVKLPFTGYSAPAWWILAKYNFQLPKVSEPKINKGIKKACQAAGINAHTVVEHWAGGKKIMITGEKWQFCKSHTGKKTFITILARKGVPLPDISDLCATTIQTIIKSYIGKADTRSLAKSLVQAQPNGYSIMKKAL